MQAVIMAGGKGTRLTSVTNNLIPKPMVKLNKKPIIEYQIEVMKKNGISDIYIVTGHLHENIENYFGDGREWNVSIKYVIEDEPLGTAGALIYLKKILQGDFFLVFGDIMFDLDIVKMIRFHKEKKALVTLLVHPNSHPYDSDLVVLDDSSKVCGFCSKKNIRKTYYHNIVNAGIYCINDSLLSELQIVCKLDLEKDLILRHIEHRDEIYGYYSTEYIKDIGTPERFQSVAEDLKRGVIRGRNISLPQKCIFLDRDGTLNKHVGLINKAEQLELECHVVEAINLAHENGYLVIVITNQPVIARNLCSLEELDYIHKKLDTLLGKKGAYIDSIKFCPHHPDKGYPEERKEYKIDCECRKPGIGLIEQAVKEFHIDLSQSFMIGDTTVDIKTGQNAGIKTIMLKTGEAGSDGRYDVKPDFTACDLLEAVKWAIGGHDEGL